MAYTEFYCQNGGSNVNSGTDTNNTASYTTIHGNWTNTTGVFTVQDGTNPSLSINVGDRVAVYVDGASVAAWIGEVSAVQNAINGTITANTRGVGTKPANQTGTASLKKGGAWQGPNAASGFPFTLAAWGNNQNSSGNMVRTNLKNDQTYSLTSSFSFGTSGARNVVQGYTSSVNDGGKAMFDGGTSTGAIIADAGTSGLTLIDIIFKTSITSGTTDLVAAIRGGVNFIRCVFTGARRRAILLATGGYAIRECEVYDCNKSNTASVGLIEFGTGSYGCISDSIFHDNPGSNVVALLINNGGVTAKNNIFSGTGKFGVSINVASATNGMINLDQNDFYNNVSDAINSSGTNATGVWISNTNFIKNGRGINNVNSTDAVFGYVYNCGYGAGTMANTNADVLNNFIRDGTDVTYASDVTPWTDPDNGDWSINLAAAISAGRGAFTTTASSYGPTVGYPDIGAAQALVTPGGAAETEGFASGF